MRTFLLFIFATSLINNAGIADPDLASLQWKKRVLVVLASSENDPLWKSQRAIAEKASAGFVGRDLTMVSEIAGKERSQEEFFHTFKFPGDEIGSMSSAPGVFYVLPPAKLPPKLSVQ
jgi:Domain of unknown function (DUF4174)